MAQAAALAQPPQFGTSGHSVTLGLGSYAGYSALGIQYHLDLSQDSQHPQTVSIGVAVSGSSPTLIRAGMNFGW